MTTDISALIDTLPDDVLLEVVLDYLSLKLEVEEPVEFTERLGTAASVTASALQELSAEAASEDFEACVALMRAALASAASENTAQAGEIESSIAAAGKKQLVVTAGMVTLGVLLIAGYLVGITGGRAKVEVTTTEERSAGGKIKVTTKTKTVFVDPFSGLGKLLKKLLPNLN